MNKTKELAKNTLVITLGKISTQFMSFFLMPLYTSVLSPEEYGIVDLVITYTGLLLPIVLFQVDQAVFRFLIDARKDELQRKKVISTCVSFGGFQSIVAFVVFLFVDQITSIPYMWYLFLNVIAMIVSNMMLQTARGLGDNVGFAVGSVISAMSQILGNILTVVVLDLGVIGMLCSTIVANILVGIYILIKDKIYFDIILKDFNKELLKDILRYSIPLIPNALCWWMLNASDRTIVMMFLGTSANGLLAVSHKFPSMYIHIYNFFNLSWTESAALHINDDDREEFFSQVIGSMFNLFMSVAIGILAVMPFVFPIMVNVNYSKAYEVIPIFMLSSMFNVVVGLYSVIYIALKKTKEVAKTSIFSGIINIIVHLLLIKYIGLFAAGVSTAVALGIMALYRYIDIKKYINITLSKKMLTSFTFMFVVTCIAYYSGNQLLQVGVLLIDFIFAMWMNRIFIKEFFGFFRKNSDKG